MIEQLYPCDHCGGRATLGRSQRLIDTAPNRLYDFSSFGRFSGPPRIGDMLPRPPTAPETEPLVCVYCTGCGMTTPWVPIGSDELAAKNNCAHIWNNRLNRPKATDDDIRSLIERELGACDAQLVFDLIARNEGDWDERGPLFQKLAQRIVDATITTIDTWPISPVLDDAARYRKLMQLAKFVELDGERFIQFPKIPTQPEHDDYLFEDRIAMAIDSMPDRDRW